MRGIHLIPAETKIDFIGKRFLAFVLSAVILLGSVYLIATKGLNFGIDFTGGTVIEVRTPVMPDLPEMRTVLNELELGSISIQEFGAPDDLLIRLPQQEGDPAIQKAAIDAVRAALDAMYQGEGQEGEGVDYRRTEFVGPQVGKELKKQGFMAVLFSLAGILAYIWLRFEWQFGVAAVVALLHDAIATVGLFALTQMEFNLSTVAAILMIAGYSINDTVVVFDRIREDLRRYKKKPLDELFNISVNQMLARTVMTSVTTLVALVALYMFGGEVIRGFIYALIFGVVIGTYSSVFIAAPTLMFMNIRRTPPPAEEQAEGGGEESSA